MTIGKVRIGISETIVALIFGAGSVLTWVSATNFAQNPDRAPATLLVGVLLSATTFGLLTFVEPINRWLLRVVFALAFLLVVPIAFSDGLYLGLPVALLGVMLVEMGMWRARRARDMLRYPVIIHVVRRSLPHYFSALSVVLTAIFFLSPIGSRTIANPLPEPLVQFAVGIADPIVQPLVGYSIQGSVDEIISAALVERLPPGAEIDPDVISIERERYATRYNIDIEGEDTFADILISMVNVQTDKIGERLDSYYKAGFFLAAFFVFQLMAFPFSWITVTLLLMLMGLLRTLRVVSYKIEQAPSTTLRWRGDTTSNAPKIPVHKSVKEPETQKEIKQGEAGNVG